MTISQLPGRDGLSGMGAPGRFVGVGIDVYEGSDRQLAHAVAEVKAVAKALGTEFTGEPLLDANESQVRDHLKSAPGSGIGSLVLL